jgi:hypothetical protein
MQKIYSENLEIKKGCVFVLNPLLRTSRQQRKLHSPTRIPRSKDVFSFFVLKYLPQ